MKLDKRKKKWLLSGTAAVLVLAIGAGIWFGVVSKSEPVNVYCFNYIGMTEFWGDNQESYGPVTTDKIQTVVLSDTQTVTKVLVSEGDQVKEGDVLMTYDTTLSDLALERKRLDVEKKKLELQAAKEQLQKIKNMTPMDPNALNPPIPEPTIPDLGETLKEDYLISKNKEYDGSDVAKALICWMKDGVRIDDNVLRALYDKAQEYQTENANKQNSSASVVPSEENPADPPADPPANPPADPPANPSADPPVTPPVDSQEPPPADPPETPPSDSQETPPADPPATPPAKAPVMPLETADDPPVHMVTISIKCNGQVVETIQKDVSTGGVRLNNAYTYQDKTYWLQSATRVSDGQDLATYTIPAYPEDTSAQTAWEAAWGGGITVEYIRSVSIRLAGAAENDIVPLEPGRDVSLCFYASMEDAPKNGQWKWEVKTIPGDAALQAAPDHNFLILSGKPGKVGEQVAYTVSATYTFTDWEGGSRAVQTEFRFTTKVGKEEMPGEPVDNFFAIIKVTEDDRERGIPLIWQGVHVYCYDDDSFAFTLFDASVLEDYTLTPIEVEETEPPEIDLGSGYTAAEIAKMRSEQEKKIKEQELAMRMADAEYKIMLSEVNNGQVCADFDGEVVSVITEEEARQDKRPLLKVSAGGGFYIDGTVSELEKDNLTIGQEVTVSDWETGMTYTGTVQSIGDFPSQGDGWNGMGNPNASYYPFTAFVDGSADLQAGRYVSVSYSTGTGENGIYLENPFVRTENGQSYVFVRGQNGRLEKRFVTVGKSLWGSYTEIKGGLTEDDYIAFPYGKTVKEGAPTAEGDLNSLYMY